MTPEQYAAFYRGRGYDFVAVTDHWKVTDMSRFADANFAVVPGTELDGSDEANDEEHHVVGLGVTGVPPTEAAKTLQSTVDAIHALGGMAFVAHPYWCAQTSLDLLRATGYTGIEVWNTFCEEHYGKGVSSVQWDEVLQTGRLIAALATDDAHQRPGQGDFLGKGRVVVRAGSLDAKSILAALAEGQFYSSTGPEIHDVQVETAEAPDGPGAVVSVHCSPCRRVNFISKNALGHTVIAPEGGEFTEATQRVHRSARYVRVECVDAAGRRAWSNPIDLRR